MAALSGEWMGAILRIENPAGGELAAAPIPRGQHGPPVVAAAHDDARQLAIEISDAGQKTIDAIADRVIAAVAADATPAAEIAALRNVLGAGEGGAGLAGENREVFRTF